MKIKYFFIPLLLCTGTGIPQTDESSSCVVCHTEMDSLLANQVKQSVHGSLKEACVGCHGGNSESMDPEISMSAEYGFVGRPGDQQIPTLCADCHSDAEYMSNFDPNIPTEQYDRYLTSQHGILLEKGDDKVATCTDCHGIHAIQQASTPTSRVYPLNVAETCATCHADKEYMAEYSIPTDQYTRYQSSVHGEILYSEGDLSAPTCNDCHGNHGAMPPNIGSIANVCGTCHVRQAELFANSPHQDPYLQMGLSQCKVCHGNHLIHRTSDELLGINENSVCIDCHDQDSQGYKVAKAFASHLDSLSQQIALAESMISQAQQAGVEISDERLTLSSARDALTQSRVLIHGFSMETIDPTLQEGYQAAQTAIKIGKEALQELKHRRNLLIVMVVLTLLAAFFLAMYIQSRKSVYRQK